MDWLKDLLENNLLKVISVPSFLSLVNFFANITISLSDGTIDSAEFHSLLSSASALESIILLLIMIALKLSKKDNEDKDK